MGRARRMRSKIKVAADRSAAEFEERQREFEMQRDHTIMKSRELFGTRNRQIAHYMILTIAVMIVSSFLIYKSVHEDELVAQYFIGGITFHFDNMLVLLMSGIIGFVPAMVCFSLAFVNMLVFNFNEAYSVFIYLIAATIAFAGVRGRWYERKKFQTIVLGLLFAFILGDLQAIIGSLIHAEGLSSYSLLKLASFFIGELPECMIAVGITYIFFNFVPDEIKTLTFNGFYYTTTDDYDRQERFLRTSRLSRRVTGIIVAEGIILGVAAVAFANGLIPSIADNVLAHAEGYIWTDIFSIEETTLNNNERKAKAAQDKQNKEKELRFVLNASGFAFDLKLLMMILNTLIPFSVFADHYAQSRIVRPITSMAASMRDFCNVDDASRENELKKVTKLPIHNDDEIGELYDALCNMATRITGFVDQMREKERLQADLMIAKKSSENKTNFLSSVSHELRTPINAVLGLDEMILRESEDENILGYASDIQNAGKTLLGLVNDILDSSKLEEGKMEIIPTEYELASTINDLINMIAIKAADKNLAFDVEVDKNTPHFLYGDEVRIKQVILNILTNAVKYTEKGSVCMAVGFERIDELDIYLCVSVKDTGIGIKEEDMKRLFSRFERIEESRNKDIEGSGLGMSIVKQLLSLMGSQLSVESVYGEGSDFSFKVRQRVTKWEPIGNFTEMYKASVEERSKYRAPFIAPDARILVVDDTPVNLTVVKGLLKETGIAVDTAESGAETLEKVKAAHYDIIFLDQRMPKMDGTETLHAMEELSDNQCKGVPVIALTANAVSGSRERYLKEGFTDYLSKPIDSIRLEEMIKTYLPEGVVIEETDERYAKMTEKEEALQVDESIVSKEDKPTVQAAVSPLKGITSIDYNAAINNCGNEEVLMTVLKDYLEAIPGRSVEISRFFEERDYENYTILVHALKSSSRLIGAMQLSADAAYLESCGDKAVNGDVVSIAEIEKKTPELLKLYRSYYDKLAPLVMGEDETDVRPVIPEEELREAYEAIREFVDAFDFDSADDVMTMLSDYQIPEEEAEHFSMIKKHLAAVDRDAVLKVL